MSPSSFLTRSSPWLLALGCIHLGGTASAQIATEKAKYVPHNIGRGSLFGSQVAIAGDKLLARRTFRVDWLGQSSGNRPDEVHVLDRNSGAPLGVLAASDGTPRNDFGSRIAVDGQRVVIGATQANGIAIASGAAYVFDLQSMQETAKLTATDAGPIDSLGTSLSLDGTRVLVGAPRHAGQTGAAYLFDTVTGTQLLKLTPVAPGQQEWFGSSVWLDGNLAAVGALYGGGGAPGSVYVFDLTTGVQIHKFQSQPQVVQEQFGTDVALWGGQVLVGSTAWGAHAEPLGAVYIFDGVTGLLQGEFKPSEQSAARGFGSDLAIDGGRLAVGAPGANTGGWRTGSVYVFDLATGQLVTELVQRTPSTVSPYGVPGVPGVSPNDFAQAIDYDAGQIVVGAPRDFDHGSKAGAIYTYDDADQNSGAGSCYAGEPGQLCPCFGLTLSSGCPNSVFPGFGGAILHATGDAQFANDSLTLHASSVPAGTPCVLLYGASQSAQPFGEGYLCTSTSQRYPAQVASSSGMVERTGLSANATPGQSLTYQYWYRDSASSCGTGNSNLTNSWTVAW